jgi:virulence-associated protein VapD
MIARIQSKDFNDILEAARKLDKGALLRLKHKRGTLDIKDDLGIATPAAYFAYKCMTGHPDSVIAPQAIDLLRKLGASNDYIAMGYAAAGNFTEAERLRNQFGVRLKPLAIGAAMCADTSYADKLLLQYQLPTTWLIYGATLVGNYSYAEAFANKIDEDDDLYKFIKITQLKAAKQSGQIDHAVKIKLTEKNDALRVRLDTLFLSDSASVKSTASRCKNEIRKEELCVKSTTIPKGARLSKLTNHDNLEEVIIWMEEGGYFHNNAIITYEFSFIKDEAFIEKLCCAADRLSEKAKQSVFAMFSDEEPSVNYRQCQRQARLIRRLMAQFLFDYDQATAYLKMQDLKALFFHLVYKSQEVDFLMAMVRGMTGLTLESTQDLLEKYFLFHAKTYAAIKLDNLSKKHGAGGVFSYLYQTNSTQKLDRVHSLLAAVPNLKNFNELEDVLLVQHGLFSGSLQLEPNSLAPKHMQPLSNHDKTCELNPLVDEILMSKYLDRNNMPRVKI